jgi:hypothetical protein
MGLFGAATYGSNTQSNMMISDMAQTHKATACEDCVGFVSVDIKKLLSTK